MGVVEVPPPSPVFFGGAVPTTVAVAPSPLIRGQSSLMPSAKSNREPTRRREASPRPDVQLAGLQRRLGERDGELAQLRRCVEELQSAQAQRDEQLESALYEMSAATGLAGLTGAQASQRREYFQTLRRIREIVRERLPRAAVIAVASKGHDEMLRLHGRTGWHFPQDREGAYAGYYPSNSLSAVVQLEAARSRGAQYFLLPQFTFWWLEKYADFARHLDARYELLVRDEACAIFDLTARQPASVLDELVAECRNRLGREPAVLDWGTKANLAALLPDCAVFSPAEKTGPLPYLDATIDIVAIGARGSVLKEARRVAREAVLKFRADGATAEIVWRAKSPATAAPTVSIIIPCHNGVALTDACLRSLMETLPANFRGEIIVVDDASTDGTAASLRAWAAADPRVKPLRNAKNLGFLETANRGAKAATGEFLVFLNNDLVLLPGWLPPLLRTFRDFPDAGGVGGKLIFPDGTLQEAGGMLFRDGSAAHFGRGDHALDAPLYNFVRPADYCSAALFATPRALFTKLGGFDQDYAPAYYEDTDYCCAVRAAGRRIYYQPESAAVHVEGASCGTDLTKGAKRHQTLNQKHFAKKWRKLLHKLPARPEYADTAAWQALAMRGAEDLQRPARRALFCSYCVPRADRDSGSKRIWDLLHALEADGWKITFVGSNGVGDARYARLLQRSGIAVHDGLSANLEEIMAAVPFDLAVFAFWPVAEYFLPVLRRVSPRTRVIVDSLDLHFVRHARRIFGERHAHSRSGLLDPAYASQLSGELNSYAAADAVVTVSEKEAGLISDLIGEPTLAQAIPDAEGIARSGLPFAERQGIVIIGSYEHPPNVEAVGWFCREIVPRLPRKLLAAHPIQIVGNGLNETVRSFGKGLAHVRMVGWVPEIEPYLHRARISVVPLLHGAGTKRKMIQALMAGTPTVTTTIGAEGLSLEDGKHALIADAADAFAKAIEQLLGDEKLWLRLQRAAGAHAGQGHSPAAVNGRFLGLVESVLRLEPKPALLPEITAGQHLERLNYQYHQQLLPQMRKMVAEVAPEMARIAVATGGSAELLKLERRQTCDFMQNGLGEPAPAHPSDSTEAIHRLKALQSDGVEFLVLPNPSLWWLEHFGEFRTYLDEHCQRAGFEENVCAVYDLRGPHVVEKKSAARAHDRPDFVAPAQDAHGAEEDVRLIAFYLPQFHPIPENNEWWGEGFTEWRNVVQAQPLFPGHHQPQLPADLGYYDLRAAETRAEQARLARQYGVFGFCYYHYWFSGKRLLERPFSDVLASGEPDLPFCLCWANEPWSRQWDGRPHDVLQPQTYSEEDDLAHIHALIPALSDPRAIKVGGKPLFLVYQGRELPAPARTIETWRREVESAGLPGLYLLAVESGWDAGWDATQVGFDAKVLFQPQFSLLRTTPRTDIEGKPELHVFDYEKAWPVLANPEPVSYRRYDTVFPAWDNTARKGDRGWAVHNSTPEAYEEWLRTTVERARQLPEGERIVFVNAWNEWAEGAHLEPDHTNGRAYLEATRRVVRAAGVEDRNVRPRRQAAAKRKAR